MTKSLIRVHNETLQSEHKYKIRYASTNFSTIMSLPLSIFVTYMLYAVANLRVHLFVYINPRDREIYI